MAKGRMLTVSRSERYLGSYSYDNSHGANAADLAEFGEEEIWSTVDGIVDIRRTPAQQHHGTDDDDNITNSHPSVVAVGDQSSFGGSGSSGGSGSISRGIFRGTHRCGSGMSLAFEDSGIVAAASSSSRIVHQLRGREANAASPSGRQMASSAPVNVPDWSKIYRVNSVESLHDSDDCFDDRDSEMMPPHEYLAREYTRNRKVAATSVFEGVGRTLKGRDMRRVRDAIWSQTGVDG